MAGIRIDIGPLKWDKFCSFLPTFHTEKTNLHNRLKDLCQIYVGLDYTITAKLILDCSEIKPTLLQSQIDHTHTTFHLGLNTWLRRKSLASEDVSTQLRFGYPG